jgi:twitching motility protein PilT
MNKEQIETFETQLELDFALTVPNNYSFRVNVFHELNGIGAVFRVVPDTTPTLEELKTPPVFKELLNLKNGLILVTGATGSGKSTTLAAMINYINANKACHIVTIEDPIEFTYKNQKSLINQRQLHRDTTSFAAALRASLREDPDVILVGEMRDLETIRLVLTAAETGHLVMATLHTSSAPHAVSRIVDVFPAGEKNIIRNLISESLRAVICQTLIKKISGDRIAAFEVMVGTPAIRNLIREDKISQIFTVMQTSGSLGMRTMEQAYKELMNKNIIGSDTVNIYEKL